MEFKNNPESNGAYSERSNQEIHLLAIVSYAQKGCSMGLDLEQIHQEITPLCQDLVLPYLPKYVDSLFISETQRVLLRKGREDIRAINMIC